MNPHTSGLFKRFRSTLALAQRAYRPYKKQILVLTLLGFLSGLLEAIGINALIPLLTFVLNLSTPATDTISLAIRTFFEWIHVPFVPRFLLAFIIVLFIGKALVAFYLSYLQMRITTEYERSTRSQLFTMVLRASWPYLLQQKLGNLETGLMIDTPLATNLFSRISGMIMLGTSLFMYLIVAFSISAPVTLATFVLALVIFIVLRPIGHRVHTASASRATLYRDTLHHVTEHMNGLKTVKALGVEDPALALGEALFAGIKRLTMRIQIYQQISLQSVPPIGVIYIAALLAISLKTPFVSLAAMPAVLYLIYRIFTYLQQAQSAIPAMSELVPHLQRVVTYQDMAGESEEILTGTLPFSFTEKISFEQVRFSYEPDREVLHGLSFDVAKGTMLGIVGPSGAGKTTCVDLMLRLLAPSSGAITLDGVDSRDIALPEWRRHIAYVSQDLFIIHGTIRDNICFYESFPDEEIWEAAKKAHIDEFLRKCPNGLDTKVGDRGVSLSAGERQRLVIARALIRKPALLILDEATSSLDNESEAHIKRVIEELKGDVTIIAIAHRLSTIMDSDMLVVIEDGAVAETGTPAALLQNPHSYFSRAYSANRSDSRLSSQDPVA